MKSPHSAAPYAASTRPEALSVPRPGLLNRLAALRAGLRAAVRAFRTAAPTKR